MQIKFFCAIALLLLAMAGEADGQSAGVVTYVDSVPASAVPLQKRAKGLRPGKAARRVWLSDSHVQSRRGWIEATYDCQAAGMTDGAVMHLRHALDVWEEQFDTIVSPILIHVCFSDEMDDDLAMVTKVHYSKTGLKSSMPFSLYSQSYTSASSQRDTIWVNATWEWDSGWPWDFAVFPDADDRADITTAFLRHIAHVLGFGTSVQSVGGQLNYAVKGCPSPFDALIHDGQGHQLPASTASAAIAQFMAGPLYVSAAAASHPLYGSADGYVPYRSGMYFAQAGDKLMGYPCADPSAKLSVDRETLDVLEAVGWPVRPHGMSIRCDSIDAQGYGSIYRPLVFQLGNEAGNTGAVSAQWQLQLFHPSTRQYSTVASATGQAFTVSTPAVDADAVDADQCLMARVICSLASGPGDATVTYTRPLLLELRPELLDCRVQDVTLSPDDGQLSFDVVLSHAGATGGTVDVRFNYGTSTWQFEGDGGTNVIHVSGIPSYASHGIIALEVTLYNDYGEDCKMVYVVTDSDMARAGAGQRTGEMPSPTVTQNGQSVSGPLTIRDGDEQTFTLADGAAVGRTLRWQLLMDRGNGTYWSKELPDVGGSCSFTMTKEFLDRSRSVIYLFDVRVDEATSAVYSEGVLRVTAQADGGQPETVELPVRLEVLPPVPSMVFCSYREEYDEDWGQMLWPVVEVEIDARDFIWGYVETSDALGPGAIGGTFEAGCEMPHRILVDWGTEGCSYRCVAVNRYGSTESPYARPPAGLLGIASPTTPDISLRREGAACIVNIPASTDEVVIADATGKVIYREHIPRGPIRITLPSGLYIVSCSTNAHRTSRKFTVGHGSHAR